MNDQIIWYPKDFGLPVSGLAGLTATGMTQLTAQPLMRHVNVFQHVPLGSGCILPSQYSPGIQIQILNRGPNPLILWPSLGDQIENFGINAGFSILAGSNAQTVSFDEPLAHNPRTWWLYGGGAGGGGIIPPDQGGGGTPGSAGLENDNGILILTDATGWPTAATTPGALYADPPIGGGPTTIGCVGPTSPNPSAPPVMFGFITADALLALGGANLPITGPRPGSLIIWNNAGLLCVA
jgi:hypothetical protein